MRDIYQLRSEAMRYDLAKWAKWRRSPEYVRDLGYPSQSAEQASPGGADKALPAWEVEMLMDNLVENMPTDYRRVMYGAYGIPIKHKALIECRIIEKLLRLNKADNRYYWETTMGEVYRALGIAKPTFYNSLNCAKAYIHGKIYS